MDKAILFEIEKYDTIIIHRHIVPDGDAFGSQLGLKKMIELNWPEKTVYAVGNDKENFVHLGSMDVIDDSVFENALIIITDCGNVERIEDQRFQLGEKILKIDHHPNVTPYGDIQWVDTTFTSASEMIGFFAKENNLKIDENIAKTIFFGIVTDSLRFAIKTVSSRTFDVCSFLMSTNFNLGSMYKMMYKRTLNVIKAQSDLIATMKYRDGVGYIILTKEIMDRHQISFDQNGMFANLLKDIEEIDIWVTFALNFDQTYRIEFRSRERPINEIAIKWGGGGHQLASGATLKSLSDVENVINDLVRLNKGE